MSSRATPPASAEIRGPDSSVRIAVAGVTVAVTIAAVGPTGVAAAQDNVSTVAPVVPGAIAVTKVDVQALRVVLSSFPKC